MFGASPDAIVLLPNGKVEAVMEVKVPDKCPDRGQIPASRDRTDNAEVQGTAATADAAGWMPKWLFLCGSARL